MAPRKIWTNPLKTLRETERDLLEAKRQVDILRKRRERLLEHLHPYSRQRWSAAHVKAQGRCSQCGHERGRPGALCLRCLEKSRVRRQAGEREDE